MPIKRIPIIHGKAELKLHDAKVRSKAIDEFVEHLHEYFDEENVDESWVFAVANEIAERMKGGTK